MPFHQQEITHFGMLFLILLIINKVDDGFYDFVKSRKWEKEINDLLTKSRASKSLVNNPNIFKAFVMEKCILPRMNKKRSKRFR